MENRPKAPWLKYYGDIPETIQYPEGSMYEAIKYAADTHLNGNCYKNRVMAYAMQKINPNIIPTAGFAGENTWDWCFDSLPHHSTVAITTNTIRNDPEGKRLFIGGMDTLVQTLSPYAIVICGRFPEWIYTKYPGVRIIPIPCYSDLWHRRCA